MADDLWPGQPVASPESTWPGMPKAKPSGAPVGMPLDDTLTGSAVNGDTLRLSSGNNLRVYGIDAPESIQQGWQRDGSPVPIGANATAAAKALLASSGMAGPVQGMSYNRPVAPVQLGDGTDFGQSVLRKGLALAAPSFLSTDPTRQFNYMQAERLARQNHLGIHGTVEQTPADFRHDPIADPNRETIARWWDTPTPWSGLRPEVEQGLLAKLRDPTIPLDQVAEYVKANGGTLEMKSAKDSRDFYLKHGTQSPVEYGHLPQILTDNGDGAFGAGLRGFGNGVLPNWLEEGGALVDTLGGTPDRENVWNSARRIADIWANNESQNEEITGFDRQEHPWATTGGELAGGLALPLGKVRSAADLAKFGAVYGAMSGSGREGPWQDRLTGGIVGAGEGLATTVLGGKALEAIAERAGPALARWKARGAEVPPATGSEPVRAADAPAMPMEAHVGESLTTPARQPDYLFPQRPSRMDAPMTDARVAAADIQPGDVLPIPSNEVGSVQEAASIDHGRFEPARARHESTFMDRQTVRAWNGAEVPKRGPIDMVGWLRLNGGLLDQNGELTHMGLTNAARRMDLVGQEHRFGPLVNNESGRTFDDAARNAWEAGYFPDHSERPSVNEFLDALRDTHEGRQRRWLPEDLQQIDTFEQARHERYALEQQRFTDGPVLRDKSVPAGSDQPFPPASAYEEWPNGGPDFAGNINLAKLESPQDISRALSQVHNQLGGFDAATRGRITHAETEALAADLNMTPESLMARRKGQAFNAEEALAARQILAKSGNELVNLARRIRNVENPGDEALAAFQQALTRHVAIQEQVAGATAEAGRALSQFRAVASSRSIKSDVLAAIINSNGGAGKLQDAAGALLDAAETSPGQFNVLAEKLTKPRWIDKATELRYFMLLSGPQTHAANMISNTLTALGQLPEHAVAAGLGAGRRLVRGQEAASDRVYGSELGARAFGLLQGVKEGLAQFGRTLRTGETSDLTGKIEGSATGSIGGIAGKVVRAPMRALAAEDELFKAMARRMELNGLAARQAGMEGLSGKEAADRIAALTANPTDHMLEKAFDYARYVTFQRQLTGIPQTVSTAAQRHPTLKFFVPFVRTPTNLLKFAVERSPAAPLLKEWRADFVAGGARRDLAIAKATVGTGIAAWAADLARQGQITGSAPDDQNKANLLRADGWQPYSIKVGDRYYSYSRLDPFAVTLATAADLATKRDGMTERQLDNSTGLLVASVMKAMGERTWLTGISDFVMMMQDPQRNLPSYLKQQGASLVVPAGVAQAARAIDPVRRTSRGVGEEIEARTPFASRNLMPQRDVWGQPVTTERLGPDLASPITTTQRLDDPANAAMIALGSTATKFPKQHIVNGKRVDYTPAELDWLSAAAGQQAHGSVQSLVSSPFWSSQSPDAQRKAIAKAVGGARKEARASEPGAQTWPGQAVATPANSPWPGKLAEQKDIVGQLEQAIPGVGFTSGYRTPAYQAEMRRRGYKPADNSGHLDGSALDILPPRGHSMSWLRGEVGKVLPNARFLNEGDHLHVTVPGWFGAPVLGGAKRAGLVNPMARN